MTNPNAALARRWFEEVWNQHREETVREMLTPESMCKAEGGVFTGPDEFLQRVHRPFLSALPDLHIAILETVAEGDRVVVLWEAKATHSGDGLGMPPTGRRVTFRGMTWARCSNGKLLEGFDCWNLSGLMQTLATGSPPPSITVE